MKQKGFTLIELLAVIIIIAVVALITIPTILNIVENAKKSALEDSAYGIVSAAEYYYSNHLLKSKGEAFVEKSFVFVDSKNVDDLSFKGKVPKEGNVKIDSEGKVELKINDGNWCATKAVSEDEIRISNVSGGECDFPLEIVDIKKEPTTCTNGDVTATVVMNKEVAAEYKFDEDSPTTEKSKTYIENGNKKVEVKANGQTFNKDFLINNIDKITPTINFSAVDKDDSKEITVNITDEGCGNSNISYQYCLSTTGSECTPTTVGIDTTMLVPLTGVGKYKMCVLATDAAGNSKTECSDTYTISKPIMQNWAWTSKTDFHATTYKTNIISATIVNHTEVPGNATASWDVSTAKDGSVMAWVVADSTNPVKYNLYIGGKGGVAANPDSSYLFYEFGGIINMNLQLLDTSNVTNMSHMFEGCGGLTSLNISNFDTSKVTDMQKMFYVCTKLTTLDLSNFDTSNVTNMYFMFNYCSSLTSLNVNSFDTSKVTDMGYMFSNVSKLNQLNLSNFVIGIGMTNMQGIFNNCSGLTSLNLSGMVFPKNSGGIYYSIFVGMKASGVNVYVKDTTAQSLILSLPSSGGTAARPSAWSTANVLIAG